jgi:uncharacterized OsmC-like protein
MKVKGQVLENKRISFSVNDGPANYCDVGKAYGGLEDYPAPRDVLSASLGLCGLAVAAIFLESKHNISASGMSFEADYEAGDQGIVKSINVKYFVKNIPSELRESIKNVILNMCPVKNTLQSFININAEVHFD